MKEFIIYGVAVYVLGLVFSGITLVVVDWIPYVTAGMVLTLPLYGAIRQYTGKGKKIAFGIKGGRGLDRLFKPNKLSLTFCLILLVVVHQTYKDLADMFVESAVMGISTLAITFVVWEITRFIVKKTKKAQFLSFGEAVKSAF